MSVRYDRTNPTTAPSAHKVTHTRQQSSQSYIIKDTPLHYVGDTTHPPSTSLVSGAGHLRAQSTIFVFGHDDMWMNHTGYPSSILTHAMSSSSRADRHRIIATLPCDNSRIISCASHAHHHNHGALATDPDQDGPRTPITQKHST